MGKIKKILENELVGGTQTTDVYPITSTKAVYDENNKRLDKTLVDLGGKVTELESKTDQQFSQLSQKTNDILGIEEYKKTIPVDQAYWINPSSIREESDNWYSSLPIHLYKGDILKAKLGYQYTYARGFVYYTDENMLDFREFITSNGIIGQQNITYKAFSECYILIQSQRQFLGECYVERDSKRLFPIDVNLDAIKNILNSDLNYSKIIVDRRKMYDGASYITDENWCSSAPLHLNAGDRIICRIGYSYSALKPLLILTNEDLTSFHTLIYNNKSKKQEIIDYTATNECYIIVQSNRVLLGDCVLFTDSKRLINLDDIAIQTSKEWLKPWVQSEIDRIVSIIDSKQTHDIIVVGFNTDQHINVGSADNIAVLRGLWAMNHLTKKTTFNLIALGGDSAGYEDYNSYENVARDMEIVTCAVDTDMCPVVSIAGNHEADTNFSSIPKPNGRFVFNNTAKKAAIKKQLDYFVTESTNCYFDDLTAKTRFIFLDVWSKNSISGQATNDVLSLALEDSKLYQGEWSVIFISHNVIKAVGNNIDNPFPSSIWDIINEKISDGLNILMCINGHSHIICQGVYNGIPFFGSTTASYSNDSGPSYDGITYERKINTATETSFDVYLVDRTEQKIYALQYGAGSDRQFNMATKQFEYCSIRGQIVLSNGETVEGGVVTATYHNTVHTVNLDSTGNYQFNYLCPGREWEIKAVVGDKTNSVLIDSSIGEIVQDIEINS